MVRFHITRSSSRIGAPGVMGRLGISLFFLVFLAAGLLFTGIMVYVGSESVRTRFWNQTPCIILSSAIEERPRNRGFRFVVEYSYEIDGVSHTSDVLWSGYSGGNDYGEKQRLLERFPAGAEAVCYVHPDEPSRAVLDHGTLWPVLLIPFPLIFVAIGAGGLWFTWRRGGERLANPVEAPGRPIAATRRRGPASAVAFFSLFFLAGAGFLFGWFVPAAMKVLAARSWDEVPATVISSAVRTHNSSDSTTYNIDILYEYEIDDRTYRSNRYHFLGGSSSGYHSKRAVVDQHPPGGTIICYVDPLDPAEAVLNPNFTWAYLAGLIPLVFMLIGLGGVGGAIYVMRRRRRAELPGTEPAPDWLPVMPVSKQQQYAPATDPGQAPLELCSGRQRWWHFIGILLAAAFWNGIISVFLFGELIPGWRRGDPDYFLTVFLIPFVVIGLVLIGGIGYTAMALLNPAVRIRLERGYIRLGESVKLTWSLGERYDRVQRLEVHLEALEEVAVQQGKGDTSKRQETFKKITLADIEDRYEIGAGSAMLQLPRDTMHSFEAGGIRIVWKLVVRGRIRFWPDVKDEWEIVIRPAAVREVAAWRR